MKRYRKGKAGKILFAVMNVLVLFMAVKSMETNILHSLLFAVITIVIALDTFVGIQLRNEIEAKKREIDLYKSDLEKLRKIDTTIKSQGW